MRTKVYEPCQCELRMVVRHEQALSVAPDECPVHGQWQARSAPEDQEERQEQRRVLATRLFEDAMALSDGLTSPDISSLASRSVFAADALLSALVVSRGTGR